MLKCLVSVAIACFMVGAPVNNVNKESDNALTINAPLMASYNDNDYQVTFTASEMNDIVWNNWDELINQSIYASALSYNNLSYSQSGPLGFNNASSVISYNATSKMWQLYNQTTQLEFEYDVIFTFDNTHYADYKQAIEADVLANSPSETMPSISEIFNEVTSVITNFIGSLGQAFNSVTALFWDSTAGAFTFLGVLILIGVGAGLVYLAYRVIKGLMHRV